MTRLRRLFSLLPAVALMIFGSSCSDFWVSESSIQSVVLSPGGALLKVGQTPADTFDAGSGFTATTVGGTTTTDPTAAAWSSSNTSVVTVDKSGNLTMVGTTVPNPNNPVTITATDSGQSGTFTVVLYAGTPTITLAAPSVVQNSVPLGQSFQVNAFLGNATTGTIATGAMTWSCGSVATVNAATGVVTVPSTAASGTQFTITATPNVGAEGSNITAATISFTTAGNVF